MTSTAGDAAAITMIGAASRLSSGGEVRYGWFTHCVGVRAKARVLGCVHRCAVGVMWSDGHRGCRARRCCHSGRFKLVQRDETTRVRAAETAIREARAAEVPGADQLLSAPGVAVNTNQTMPSHPP